MAAFSGDFNLCFVKSRMLVGSVCSSILFVSNINAVVLYLSSTLFVQMVCNIVASCDH